MRRALVLLVVGLLALTAFPPDGLLRAAPSAQSARPVTGAISGVVTDAMTGAPVAGARVSLARTGVNSERQRALTDVKGRFVFADLPAAPDYFLDGVAHGYASTRYGWSAPGQSLATADILQIPVAEGQWVDHIKIPLWRYGSITGYVTDERREPVIGVIVRAYTLHRVAGHLQPVFGPIATTDDRGVYRLAGLAPGRYLVAVQSVQSTVLSTTPEAPAERPMGSLALPVVSGGRGAFVAGPAIDVNGTHRLAITNFATPPPPSTDAPRAYAPAFYPGVTRAADAQEIAVTFGDVISDIDVPLSPVSAVRVSGHVEGIVGPMPNLLLRLLPVGHESMGFGAEVATTPLDTNGSFTFLNVPAGDYTLLAQATVIDFATTGIMNRPDDAPGFPGRGAGVGSRPGVPGLSYLSRSGIPSAWWGRQRVSVGNQPIDNLALTMRPVMTVSGRLVFEPGTSPPEQMSRIVMTPANGDPSLGEPAGPITRGPEGLTFTVSGLMGGTYLLTTRLGTYAVMSTIAAGRDVTYTGIDGAAGQDIDDVVVTLTSRRPVVNGTVQGADGPARAAVLVFPQDRTRWVNFGWDPTWLQTRGAAANGAFMFDTLPEGEYFIAAVDMTLRHGWTDPEFLARLVPSASRLSLRWGADTTVNLRVLEIK